MRVTARDFGGRCFQANDTSPSGRVAGAGGFPGNRRSGLDHAGKLIERSSLFSGISAEHYPDVFSATRVREFSRDDVIYSEGQSAGQVIMITAGTVKISRISVEGAEVILKIGVPGDILGATGLVAGVHSTTAQAFAECRVVTWDTATFKDVMRRYPLLRQNMVGMLDESLQELQTRFMELATSKVAPRVARQLERLAEQIGREVEGSIEIQISREELAQMTGTTLFSVSRLLAKWEEEGLLRSGREMVTVYNGSSFHRAAEEM